jgi:hypothetical protein
MQDANKNIPPTREGNSDEMPRSYAEARISAILATSENINVKREKLKQLFLEMTDDMVGSTDSKEILLDLRGFIPEGVSVSAGEVTAGYCIKKTILRNRDELFRIFDEEDANG